MMQLTVLEVQDLLVRSQNNLEVSGLYDDVPVTMPKNNYQIESGSLLVARLVKK